MVGGGIIWAVRLIGFYVLRQEAMGFGDVVLMAAIGSFIGWQPVVIVFFLAAMLAMVSVLCGLLIHRRREIPYGPYLSLGTLLLILERRYIWPYARSYFDLGAGVFFMLGIPLYAPETAEWTSADTLHHYAGEKVDPQQGQWRRPVWPGSLSGRGQSQYETWRHGDRNSR